MSTFKRFPSLLDVYVATQSGKYGAFGGILKGIRKTLFDSMAANARSIWLHKGPDALQIAAGIQHRPVY